MINAANLGRQRETVEFGMMVLQVAFKKERGLRGPIELTRAWLDVIMNAVAAGEATEGKAARHHLCRNPFAGPPFRQGRAAGAAWLGRAADRSGGVAKRIGVDRKIAGHSTDGSILADLATRRSEVAS